MTLVISAYDTHGRGVYTSDETEVIVPERGAISVKALCSAADKAVQQVRERKRAALMLPLKKILEKP